MPVKKFDISQADELADYLGITLETAARKSVLSLANRILARILTAVIPAEPRQPVDRGAYRAAWKAKKTPQGAEVLNDMPYAAVIEYGARAENIKVGRAMIKALTEWVLRKGIVKPEARPVANGKAGKASRVIDRAVANVRAKQVAWAIAKNMQKRGIFDEGKGLHILDKATEGLERMYFEELVAELKKQYRSK